MNKTKAELQSEKKVLEQDVLILKTKTDEVSKAKLEAKQAQIQSIDDKMAAVELQAADTARKEADADAAIAAMEAQGELVVQGDAATTRKAELKASFTANPNLIQIVAGNALKKAQSAALNAGGSTQNPAAALGGKVAPNAASQALSGASGLKKIGLEAGASYGHAMNASAGWNTAEAIGGYWKLVKANTSLKPAGRGNEAGTVELMGKKAQWAIEAANWYNKYLSGSNTRNWEHIEGHNLGKVMQSALEAGDWNDTNDPGGSLGVLSGTLVLQRTIPVFKYKYPELLSMYTDFSDNPGVFEQTENTRIVVQPAVQKYSSTSDGSGRPTGWSTVSQAVTTNVSISLTDYVAVPIALGNQVIAATTRRLFDEQAVLAIAGIAGYFTAMLTNLITAANYNYYATAGTYVPTVYTTYVQALQTWGMSDLDKIDAAFTSAKVPEDDRGVLLTPLYYAKLRGDPRLEFYYAASAKSVEDGGDFMTEAMLPKLSGFAPYKAGYLPSSTPATNPTTNNLTGFAYQKSAVLLKSRLPTDFSQALNTMVPGSITTVTDPDTKISLMLVQYVNLTQNYAEWRPEVMLGAAVADNRAGLCITSQ